MSTVLQDTFTDTNGTNLTAHTMNVGAGWTVHGNGSHTDGSYTIQSNTANGEKATSTYTLAWSNANASDLTYSCDVRITNTSSTSEDIWLTFRLQDQNNFWLIGIGGGTFTLYLVSSGGFTQMAQNSISIAGNVFYTIKTTLSGSSITCDWNSGASVINVINSTFQTQTNFGLYCQNNDTNNAYDNFIVNTPGTTWFGTALASSVSTAIAIATEILPLTYDGTWIADDSPLTFIADDSPLKWIADDSPLTFIADD